jgi:hypothetical protein
MADMPASKPASPFAGLDTSLLRSTRPVPEAPAPEAPSASAAPADPATRPAQRGARRSANRPTNPPGNRATTVSRNHDTTTDTTVSDTVPDDALEVVRRAVRTLGKEAATYRFTQDEKRALSGIVYAYKDRGIKTSENEITRIALNYLIDEYRRNSTNSILARVLARLNQ